MKELKCPKCGSAFTVDETDYAAILQQVRTAEFDAELRQRLAELRKGDDQARQIAVQQQEMLNAEALRKKDEEIFALKMDAQEAVAKKDREIAKLVGENAIKLKAAEEQVAFYKDMKTRMTTKMVGESLEVHCSDLFNSNMRMLMPRAYFEKDNEVVGGTKGDFVFRDYGEDGTEYVSILFEMKNECDTPGKKHRNEDYFNKLNEDRRKKNCEYAVLVSLLEPESELYNNGIVDVSHHYEKMYVVRPQFFLAMISILVQAARNNLKLRQELSLARQQTVDITNFETKLLDYQEKIGKNCSLAKDKFDKAIDEIDKAIKALTNVKESLLGSEKKLLQAKGVADELTIRKLTHGNPTMREQFAAVRKQVEGQEGARRPEVE